MSVGTTTSGTTAAVTNSGTSTNAILNFTLPTGPAGLHVITGSTATSYSVAASDRTVVINNTGTPTVVLPAPSASVGRMVYLMAGGNHFTVTCTTPNAIEDGTGTTSQTTFANVNSLSILYEFWTLICVSDGTYWYIN